MQSGVRTFGIKSIICMKNRITFYLWKKINSIYYSGDKVLCLNCTWNGNEFLNGRCPKCNSLPRTRFFAFCIKSYYENYSSILHVSPNQSEFNFIKNQLNIGKFDRLDKRKISHINLVMDLVENLGIINSYQFIIIWHVLEHIEEDITALRNLFSALKPGGKLIASVPIFPAGNPFTFEDKNINKEEYETVHGHPDHVRSCGYDYKLRFEKVGFSNIETIKVANLPKDQINQNGLSIDHIAWVCEKPK